MNFLICSELKFFCQEFHSLECIISAPLCFYVWYLLFKKNLRSSKLIILINKAHGQDFTVAFVYYMLKKLQLQKVFGLTQKQVVFRKIWVYFSTWSALKWIRFPCVALSFTPLNMRLRKISSVLKQKLQCQDVGKSCRVSDLVKMASGNQFQLQFFFFLFHMSCLCRMIDESQLSIYFSRLMEPVMFFLITLTNMWSTVLAVFLFQTCSGGFIYESMT